MSNPNEEILKVTVSENSESQNDGGEHSHFEIFQHEFELSLEDNFLSDADMHQASFLEEENLQNGESDLKAAENNSDAASKRTLKADSESFPSVLVDEQLLKEIADIPDRFGFKIGDVADLLGIKQYVLRYWEQEFDLLKPKKASNNQRFYTRKDVENAFLIRKLLYRDKFSIEGARQALRDVKFVVKKEKDKEKDFSSVIQKLDFVQDQIKAFVSDIRKTRKYFN
ncbi:MAG: MerR family transcriptional regulator [Pseudobdellovibrio sp.]